MPVPGDELDQGIPVLSSRQALLLLGAWAVVDHVKQRGGDYEELMHAAVKFRHNPSQEHEAVLIAESARFDSAGRQDS